MNTLALLVHGPAKVGKTRLAATAPAPRLFLDAEGGTRFLPNRIEWDPKATAPPVADGGWENCIVYVRDFQSLELVYQWLQSGQHPFSTVVLDSISEIQQRCIDAISGVAQMTQQGWGELLRKMALLVRNFRDLTFNDKKPVECVIIIAMTRAVENKWTPHVQGQLITTLPYYIDVVGYLFQDNDDTTGAARLRLLTSPHPQFEAGDRTGRLGAVVDYPDIPKLFHLIFTEGS
jgi:hypothetical protein